MGGGCTDATEATERRDWEDPARGKGPRADSDRGRKKPGRSLDDVVW